MQFKVSRHCMATGTTRINTTACNWVATMLARTILLVPQTQCSSSLSLKATPLQLHQGRLLVVPRASYSSRSSSPRSESWRSSWRTELEHGSNGNGNGAHVSHDDEYQIAYNSNGNYYHAHDSDTDSDFTWGSSSWRNQAAAVDDQEVADVGYSNGWRSSQDQPAGFANRDEDVAEEEESSGGGFFTDAFKEALKSALQRSPLYADQLTVTGSADEEVTEPQPYENEVEVYDRPIFTDQFRAALKESLERQQSELDAYGGQGSDDEYTATPYVPSPPRPREMSPLEEVIATALGASQLHLRRLTLMKNEIDAAIERETKQIERLGFALSKAQSDMAYYKSLEEMMAERPRGGQ
ncbi:hypothetical protein VOLCADRAFT_106241 [Volvox carteri f. nagariensis]|uniref:Uncharacterized protein n=1 Tax=Volvox carteri f. nagariensis TaxID=3068 RepID=D8U628_VOLCA|nr:uncharacterized protein VOLCADRAFT_106241 [Volvox carteri f. nagariensis]EFJ44783.1 hypothetical protein VOLCADRAFT_106241 [Volvox carteri f. nagariensis]|eukprot:XP_002954066.1 hypothetical protein VOLCADRAFT_106241 [Volvox carteri f. nagariensis]